MTKWVFDYTIQTDPRLPDVPIERIAGIVQDHHGRPFAVIQHISPDPRRVNMRLEAFTDAEAKSDVA